jgi:hypothetical protein
MNRYRSLLLANGSILVLLLVVLLVGWQEAAAFGLAVLVILDLLVILRERLARLDEDPPSDPQDWIEKEKKP